MNLLVLTLEGYQDIELVGFLGALNAGGQTIKITYWNPDGQQLVGGSNQIGQIKTTSQTLEASSFDAIFIPGGKACVGLRANTKALTLIEQFIKLDKYIFAICDAPNALVDAKLQLDKKYVSYPIANIDTKATSLRIKDQKTFADGKYITGDSPLAAIDLALLVLKTLYGAEVVQLAHQRLNGS